MCGIAGVVSWNDAIDAAALGRAAATLRHRGPDGAGEWISPDRRIGLAHRRLAIVDLSPAGAQPMATPDQRVVVTFNGEIYNFRQLREDLAARGWSFRSHSDTEVLLAAYCTWGRDCLRHLVGMFAFVLVDLEKREVFAARDRAGEKPLFYQCDARGLVFASEVKALLALDPSPRVANVDALNAYLALGYVPGDAAMIAGVHKLPPGHALSLSLDRGQPTVWRYWTLPVESEGHRDGDAVDVLERLLRNAVGSQLEADVPVGVLLSGGLDSSLVAALAASGSARRVLTFNVSFPDYPALDEAVHARAIATHFGTEHTELTVGAVGAEMLSRMAAQYDDPMADSSMIPTVLLSEAVRQHVTVALGGDGGDELFGGYPHYSRLLRMERLKSALPQALRTAVSMASSRLPTGVRGRNLLVSLDGDLRKGVTRVNQYFDETARRRMLAGHPQARTADWSAPERARMEAGTGATTDVGYMRRVDFNTYLPDDILVKVDRASMLASLEVRAPFLDHRVMEFAFTLDAELTATPEARKVILRRLASRLLPKQFDAARKQGFTPPLAQWILGPWRPTVEAALDALPAEWVHPDVIASTMRGLRRGLPNAQRIFALTMLSLWRDRYRIGVA